MIYFESPYARVSWNERIDAVVLQWTSFAEGEHFRTPMNKALELSENRQAKKVLYDTRRLPFVTPEDERWVNEEWYPRPYQYQIRFAATVIPEDLASEASVNEWTASVGAPPLAVGVFARLEDAAQWLYEVD